MKFVTRLCRLPYESAIHQLRSFSLLHRRIRGDLICMFKVAQGLHFRWGAVLVDPTRFGYHSQNLRRQYVVSLRAALHWNKLPEGILNALSVEIVKARLSERWLSLFPEACLPPRSTHVFFHPTLSHTWSFKVCHFMWCGLIQAF